MRGDPPPPPQILITLMGSTPHARGSTACKISGGRFMRVYPACAGIHRYGEEYIAITVRLPRMRGDPPELRAEAIRRNMSTPHARGSTTGRPWVSHPPFVYPACAGIHPIPKADELTR